MKTISFRYMSVAMLAIFAATGLLTGCDSTPKDDAATTGATGGSAPVTRATPPANLDTKPMEAQSAAAKKAQEDMAKSMEGKK